jgi:hypothetical protein
MAFTTLVFEFNDFISIFTSAACRSDHVNRTAGAKAEVVDSLDVIAGYESWRRRQRRTVWQG